jgi:hypothetical protein
MSIMSGSPQSSIVVVGASAGGFPRSVSSLRVSDDARPDDGWLDAGVTTAHGPLQWPRTLGRIVLAGPHTDRVPGHTPATGCPRPRAGVAAAPTQIVGIHSAVRPESANSGAARRVR